jgi:anti-anti-sigma factor
MALEKMQIVGSQGSHDGQKVLSLKGPLTIHTVFDFQAAVRAEASPVVIVDFSEVPYVDSAGLGALVGAYVAAKRVNRELAFVALNSQVKALIDMTQVSQFFRIYPTVQDAEAALMSRQD